MGIHPNAMLLVLVDPDNGSRRTYRELFAEMKNMGIECEPEYDGTGGGQFRLPNGSDGKPTDRCPGGEPTEEDYYVQVFEDDYDHCFQISGREGQLSIHDLVTYGYGDKVQWKELEAQKNRLTDLLDQLAPKLKFTYEVYIGANYW